MLLAGRYNTASLKAHGRHFLKAFTPDLPITPYAKTSMTRFCIASVIATFSAITAPFTAEGTVRLSFTENYTPPEADSDAKLFIHIDASDLSTASYDADANGNGCHD